MSRRPEDQPISQETEAEPEIFLPVSDALEAIKKSPLLEHQKKELCQRISDLAEELAEEEEGLTPLDPNLVVRAVVEGLLGVSFNQLNPREQRQIEDELRRLEIEGFDPKKV